MASEELYEVESIVDKRKNKKGTWYLVRWRGYTSEGDTWEREAHLSSCLDLIHHFNCQPREPRQRKPRQSDAATFRRSTRPSRGSDNNNARTLCRPQPYHVPSNNGNSGHTGSHAVTAAAAAPGDAFSPPTAAMADSRQQQQLPSPSLGRSDTDTKTDPQKFVTSEGDRRSTYGAAASSAGFTAVGAGRRSVDLARSGIKILVPKSPMKSRADPEESPSEAARSLEQEEGGGPDAVPPEVALLETCPGELLEPGEERARMGTRRQAPIPLALPQAPITPAAIQTLNGKGTSTLREASSANGVAGLQGAATRDIGVSGAAAVKRRLEGLEERLALDKRLRFSVRQTESTHRYRDIIVRKEEDFTHILLSTKSSENNSLNPDVMKEMQSAMATAAADDSKLVLLSAVGSMFCSGLDFIHFIRRLTSNHKKESNRMAETIRIFVNTFIQFKKPIVVAVNGPAVGLGASLLPLCDVVWANEKAWFQTPYASCGQTPDACSSHTFPCIMGLASANEMLLLGRKLTAQEACAKGLVSQVLWPGTFMQEVMARIRELVSCNSLALRESKALVRNTTRTSLEQANERECEALKRVWGSLEPPSFTASILKYLEQKMD